MAAALPVWKDVRRILVTAAVLLLGASLSGCGTPSARNFGGKWKPANGFPAHPTEIPLHPAYTFYAAPMDATLKTLLARWARDTRRELAYRAAFDVTLYAPVAAIRTADIDAAVADLNRIYAAQKLHVTATDRSIVVGPADGTTPSATTQAPAVATVQEPPATPRP